MITSIMTSGKKLFSNHAAVTAVRIWILCRNFEIGNELSPPVPLPEQHKHKNRAHIDLDVKDLEAAVRRVVDLGGTRLDEFSEYGITWAVMADPDGNEFCLVRHS